MTRITKLKRKTHENASGFNVIPLKPPKNSNLLEQESKTIEPKQDSTKRRRFKKHDRQPENTIDISETGAPQRTKRAMRHKRQKLKNMQCFACRKTGHSIKDCPDNQDSDICYKCGSSEHSDSQCAVKVSAGKHFDPTKHLNKDNPFPFAVCFVCNMQGHLASACPQNENGLYPNGGGCKYCGSKIHLAKDCRPTKRDKQAQITLGTIDLDQGADDDDVFLQLRQINQDMQQQKPLPVKKKIVSF